MVKNITKFRMENAILKFTWISMWLFTGVIIAVMAFGMSITNSHSLSNSLKIGKVTDAPNSSGTSILLGRDNQGMFIDFMGDSAEWKYLYFDIQDMDVEAVRCKLTFMNISKGKDVYWKEVILEKGMNKIVLTGQNFDCIEIKGIEAESCNLIVRNVQLREKEKMFPEIKDYIICIIVFVFYIIGTLFLYKIIRKKQMYICIDILQDIYVTVGNFFICVPRKLSSDVRSRLRVLLLITWMTVMITTGNLKKYWSGNCYKYNLIFCLCIIFLIAVLMIEKKLKKISWNRQIVFCWAVMSVLMCISEIFYVKRFLMTGYVNLFLLGFFYFVWNNMENQKQFIAEIMSALKILFLFSVIFCLLFRPYLKEQGYDYAGPTWNPNIFIMFLIPVLVVFLSEIIEAIQSKKKWKGIIAIFQTGICISFIRLCASRMGMILLLFFGVVFLIFLKRNVLEKKQMVKAFLIFSISLIVFVPVHLIMEWGVIHLPALVGHEVEFPAEGIKISKAENQFTVQAAENEYWYDKVVYDTRVTKVLAVRNMFWMGYLRKMNFLGHEYMPVFWGTLRLAHNGVLAFAYMYGVLIIMPYIFLYLNSVGLSFIKMVSEKGNKGYAFFAFGVFVTAFFFMVEENIEQRPFLVTIWILFYLMLGILFPSDKCEIQKQN